MCCFGWLWSVCWLWWAPLAHPQRNWPDCIIIPSCWAWGTCYFPLWMDAARDSSIWTPGSCACLLHIVFVKVPIDVALPWKCVPLCMRWWHPTWGNSFVWLWYWATPGHNGRWCLWCQWSWTRAWYAAWWTAFMSHRCLNIVLPFCIRLPMMMHL